MRVKREDVALHAWQGVCSTWHTYMSNLKNGWVGSIVQPHMRDETYTIYI